MRHALIAAFAAALLAAGASGCAERPQRVVSADGQPYNVENGVSPLRARTLMQGESARMSY